MDSLLNSNRLYPNFVHVPRSLAPSLTHAVCMHVYIVFTCTCMYMYIHVHVHVYTISLLCKFRLSKLAIMPRRDPAVTRDLRLHTVHVIKINISYTCIYTYMYTEYAALQSCARFRG